MPGDWGGERRGNGGEGGEREWRIERGISGTSIKLLSEICIILYCFGLVSHFLSSLVISWIAVGVYIGSGRGTHGGGGGGGRYGMCDPQDPLFTPLLLFARPIS